MASIKTAKIGDMLQVPSILLFPQRTGKFNRHGYSVGKVINVFKHSETGETVVEVEYLEAFRYKSDFPLQVKKFFVGNCMKFKLEPCTLSDKDAELYISKAGYKRINGNVYDLYQSACIDTFNLEV